MSPLSGSTCSEERVTFDQGSGRLTGCGWDFWAPEQSQRHVTPLGPKDLLWFGIMTIASQAKNPFVKTSLPLCSRFIFDGWQKVPVDGPLDWFGLSHLNVTGLISNDQVRNTWAVILWSIQKFPVSGWFTQPWETPSDAHLFRVSSCVETEKSFTLYASGETAERLREKESGETPWWRVPFWKLVGGCVI